MSGLREWCLLPAYAFARSEPVLDSEGLRARGTDVPAQEPLDLADMLDNFRSPQQPPGAARAPDPPNAELLHGAAAWPARPFGCA